MKRDIVKPDMNLILECCQELGIKAVPAQSTEYVLLTDDNGNVMKLDEEFSIFENIDISLDAVIYTSTVNEYTIKEGYVNPVRSNLFQIINEYFEYKNAEVKSECTYDRRYVQVPAA